MHCCGLIVAGGRGRRFGGQRPKQYRMLRDRPLVVWALDAFQRCARIDSLVLVVPGEERSRSEQLLASYSFSKLQGLCEGGPERSDSVRNGLLALPPEATHVAIHDAARPLVSPELIERVVRVAAESGAALAALPATDTVKLGREGQVERTLERGIVHLAQTPQVFSVALLREAYAQWEAGGRPPLTDDAQVVELYGGTVRLVSGETTNLKVTIEEDLALAEAILAKQQVRVRLPRSGVGYDVHQLAAGQRLIIGGVEIPFEKGLVGHSDADVLAHAVGDALLGAAALGDLGQHFPPGDPRFKGADSLKLLAEIRDLVERADYLVANVDSVVVAQQPKLMPFIGAMRERLAAALRIERDRVSVKATTTEGLGFAGRGEGIAAYATVSLVPT